MNRSVCAMFGASLLLLLAAGLLAAAEPAAMPKPAQIQQWVRDLGSDQPAAREEASRRLIEAGVAALDDVEDALKSTDLEIRNRAERILRIVRKKLVDESVPEMVKWAEEGRLQEFLGRLSASKDDMDDAQLEKCWRAAMRFADRLKQQTAKVTGKKTVEPNLFYVEPDDKWSDFKPFVKLGTRRSIPPRPKPFERPRNEGFENDVIVVREIDGIVGIRWCVVIADSISDLQGARNCLILCNGPMTKCEGLRQCVIFAGNMRECRGMTNSLIYARRDMNRSQAFRDSIVLTHGVWRNGSGPAESIVQAGGISMDAQDAAPEANLFLNLSEQEQRTIREFPTPEGFSLNKFASVKNGPLDLCKVMRLSQRGMTLKGPKRLEIASLDGAGMFRRTGCRVGDLVVAIDGRAASSEDEILATLARRRKGERIQVTAEPAADIGKLIAQLGSNDFSEREKAAAALIKVGKTALEPLRKASQSKDLEVVRHARKCIEKIEYHGKIDTFAEILVSGADRKERIQAGCELCDFGKDAIRVLPVLVILLEDKDPGIRLRAIVVIKHIGPRANKILPRIFAILQDKKRTDIERLAAKDALIALEANPANAVPIFLAMLRDEPYFRLTAMDALVALGKDDERVFKAIFAFLEDKDKDTRAHAAGSLGLLGKHPDQCVPPITKLLKESATLANHQNRRCLVEGLMQFGPKASPAVPVLMEILREPRNSRSGLQEMVIRCLGAIGPQAREAIPLLREVAKEKSSSEGRLARSALAEIDK